MNSSLSLSHSSRSSPSSTESPIVACDSVRCVCSSAEDSGDQLQCEICFSWCHNNCVGISPSVVETYPFVCPFCIRSMAKLQDSVSSLRLELQETTSRVINLEKSLLNQNDQLFIQPLQLQLDLLKSSVVDVASKVSDLSCGLTVRDPSSDLPSDPPSSNPSSLVDAAVLSNRGPLFLIPAPSLLLAYDPHHPSHKIRKRSSSMPLTRHYQQGTKSTLEQCHQSFHKVLSPHS